ncbi:MAG TPA: hypothetical protein VGR62_02445 [Candidatus Binatia bacterium]|jgi:hypothetical protein|nr:hypothetical protein [Candidatus Binatia bacterium]
MRLVAAVLLVVLVTLPALAAKDFEATESDFACLLNWDKVNNVRIFNAKPRLLRKAKRVLESGRPNRKYPVGTIMQLIPGEAMVKRKKSFNPDGNGWEFFQLGTSASGTTIVSRGADAINFLGLECKACHAAAVKFDFVCEKTHGCIVLPLTDAGIDALQRADPRCPPQ